MGRVVDLALFAVPFVLATSFMGQAAGSFFRHRETAVLVFVATTLPQFFLVGVSWPREMIPPVLDHLRRIISERVGDRRFGAHRADGRSAQRSEGRLALSMAAYRDLFRAWRGRVAATPGVIGTRRCGLAPLAGSIRIAVVAVLVAVAGDCRILDPAARCRRAASSRRRPTDRDQDRTRNQRPLLRAFGRSGAERPQGRRSRRAIESRTRGGAAAGAGAVRTSARRARSRLCRPAPGTSRHARARYRNGERQTCFTRSSNSAERRSSRRRVASRQDLEKSTAAVETANANLASAKERYEAARLGPTHEERAVADAKVEVAAAAVAVVAARVAKLRIRAPSDGVVALLVAEPGEAIVPGQPLMTLQKAGQRWASFNLREDQLGDLRIGSRVELIPADGTRRSMPGSTKSSRAANSPLGVPPAPSATTISTRFLIRADPTGHAGAFQPGMSVWLELGWRHRAVTTTIEIGIWSDVAKSPATASADESFEEPGAWRVPERDRRRRSLAAQCTQHTRHRGCWQT